MKESTTNVADGTCPVKQVRNLPLASIRRDGGTQPREAIDGTAVAEYAERLLEGDSFPPVVVYHDGETYWLADGFHRVAAHETAGLAEIPAEIREGNRRDAVLASVGANAKHGLRRTTADKRRAVTTLLGDDEWRCMSDRELARLACVSDKTVGAVRADMERRAEIPHVAFRTDSRGRQQPVAHRAGVVTITTPPVARVDVSGNGRGAGELRRPEEARGLVDQIRASMQDVREQLREVQHTGFHLDLGYGTLEQYIEAELIPSLTREHTPAEVSVVMEGFLRDIAVELDA